VSVLITVQPNQTALDIVTNYTGVASVSNLDAFCKANNLTDWTTNLIVGAKYIMPDGLDINTNRLLNIKAVPVAEPITTDEITQGQVFFDTLYNTWVLTNGVWNGNYQWKSNGIWQSA
jgi:hypothetical protein